jgi:hypothetical protein
MNQQILFSEKQRFTQWWLWLILLGINGTFIYAIFTQVIGGHQFGDNPVSNEGLVLGAIVALLFTVIFFNFRLETVIKTDGLYFRFFPFHLKFRKFNWEEISKAYVREYKPVSEYGGWGLRGFGKNEALNISGNKGLQLELSNQRKILIGTNKPDELSKALVAARQVSSKLNAQ